MLWAAGDVVAAVRAALSGKRPSSRWAFDWVDLDGDRVLVVFAIDGVRYWVHYSLGDLPNGPNTGEPRDKPEEWAEEIGWDIDEQVETGGLARAQRAAGRDGLPLCVGCGDIGVTCTWADGGKVVP